ncbi:thiamine pyrophosphate-dependent dehydrogenase E1 component subunit alpha [Conexibacter sp. JD483]|uniref:thiamine pyrophosphate-dependent dehydrogenase E1 component subunit alpha n=1 Tax=unclassified Conexibacter TaxID=2627773 RepID=UPI0027156AF0|nr:MULTISPECIES: thiamine pyrophosphate-dependent dehydrogenase E1 component subunit alpha [unclassified Conexibacter]MDO8189390.1 thiamine pyrophosphate-dependent dehydrogenase E1 component subunit alpha [Conexibacter sp. CPCC 205706]MDO8202053.1 thiamine pyrophosphate-dependent dehydrogenase E1 component subunit alpha [Conexibacter sp. CPCC 205762]MDR9372698.1 thiamine pyrophosphate-dependent dehydrogenase E1 component subunit alpha [Conexibacter sp. JD483]
MESFDRRAGELLSDDDRVGLLRQMLLMRAVEERGNALYKQGKIPGSFYDGRGQEAVSVGATWALSGADPVCSPLIRDLGAHLVKGTDLTQIFQHYMGRENALSHGREGNVHFGDKGVGVVGMVSMLPDMMVVATGLAMAYRMRAEQRCALTFFGDGATSRGDWHEAMNWAGLDRLPVIFLMECNQLAYSTPSARQFARDPIERAAAYGVHATTVDGNDVEAVFVAAHDARERALAGDGPTLIEAQTFRMHGHGAHDDARYVDPGLIAEWAARDPIDRYSARLTERGLDVTGLAEDVAAEVAEAVAVALTAPMPDPATATEGVFCTSAPAGEQLGRGAERWSGFAAMAQRLPSAAAA